MKNSSYLITVLCFFVLFNNCNKTEESIIEPNVEIIVDPNFTDLNDTLVYSEWACYSSYLSLDLDKDSTNDIQIETFSSFSGGWGGSSRAYIEVSPLNGYEIAYSDCVTYSWQWNPEIDTIYHIDTVLVPKVFLLGDTILLEGDYTAAPIKLSYGSSPADSDYSSGLHYSILTNKNYYMALRKISGDNSKLVWLLVNSHSAYSISFNSCLYTENEDLLPIEEF